VNRVGRALFAFAISLALISSATALSPGDLDARGVSAGQIQYRGRIAVRLVESAPSTTGTDMLAILKGKRFHDGTIELWMTGEPGPGAAEGARGFVGVAFRVGDDLSHYEAIYIRPTNGRAEDQLRRNHSTQYISQPEYPWERLRKETPGAYESYADMAPGDWIHCRIIVAGTQARLFLGDAEQPSLVVKDLKHGDESGGIALWIGPGTVAYFSDVKVTP
jgi:hypothetical protein